MIDAGALLGILFVKPALVLSAAVAITACLRRRSAAARHAVWTGAIVAILVLPLLRIALPPLRVSLLRPRPAPTVPAVAGAPPTQGIMGRGGSVPVSTPAWLAASESVDWIPSAILVIWLTGMLGLGFRRIWAERSVRRLVRQSHPAARCLTSSPKLADVRISDELVVPAVTGLLRSVVLLPRSAESWPAADLGAALEHELGHVRRRDCVLNLVADVARGLYWCNPLVWFAVTRMRSESERACDDLVLQNGADAGGYARLLLEVARAANRSSPLPIAATAMARPRELESRLLAVLDDRIARAVPSRWTVAILALVGLFAALPAAALTLKPRALQPELLGPEPDRRGDSLASPASERLSRVSAETIPLSAIQMLRGADSMLAAHLMTGLSHTPSDEGDLVRARAEWALSRVRNGRLIEPLLESLSAGDWREQAYAAWALADLRDPRAIPLLLPLLDHSVWRLRAMAAHALRQSGDPRAESAMQRALVDPAWQVRVEAVGYFAQLGGPQVAERLTPRLRDRHIAVRLAAEAALTSR